MKVWKAVKNTIKFLRELFNFFNSAYVFVSLIIVLVLMGGAMWPPIKDLLRNLVIEYWYWFYIFFILISFFFILAIRFILKKRDQEKLKLIEERKIIGDKIFIVPRPEIFYYEVHLNMTNISSFDIKISKVQAWIDSIEFIDSFYNADEKFIKSLSKGSIRLIPLKMTLSKQIILDPKKVTEKKINGTVFLFIQDEIKEISIPINSYLAWRDTNATS